MKIINILPKIFLITIFFILHVHPVERHVQPEEEKKDKKFINSVEIIQAIESTDKEKAIDLIKENKINLNYKDRTGETALGAAISKSYLDLVKLLLEYGANVNLPTKYFSSHLIRASALGKVEIVKLLLDYNAEINDRCFSGDTALSKACFFGFTEIVRLLLNNGANVNTAEQRSGATPLTNASYFGHTEIVKMLLEHGADIDHYESNNKVALNYAIERKFKDVIILLKNWPFLCEFKKVIFHTYKNYNIHDFKLYPTLKLEPEIENIFLLLRNINNGNTLLHEAIIKRDYKLIDDIIQYNPNIIKRLLEATNKQNITPLDLSVNDELLLNDFMSFAYLTK